MNGEAAGIYLHIPFCDAKCPYCDFYSVPPSGEAADAYTDALCRAMTRAPGIGPADSLYLGGGTPSLLGAKRLDRILSRAADRFGLPADAEITLEANPGAVDGALLADLHRSGYNRVSLGVQSLCARELAALGRRHGPSEAAAAIGLAIHAGFPHVSADVMLGVPYQTAGSLTDTLGALCSSGVDHLSAYMLKIEPHTRFAGSEASRHCPDEDAVADLYLHCVDTLAGLGFAQYEISSFARPGGRSRHNLKYWSCAPYLGLGPSAHSLIGGRRFHFPRDMHAFVSAEDPFTLVADDGAGGGWEEYAMLRLRLCDGLSAGELRRRYGVDAAALLEKARPLEAGGLLRISGGVIALTPRGFLLSNAVTGALLY